MEVDPKYPNCPVFLKKEFFKNQDFKIVANFLSNRSLAGMKAESIEEARQRPRKTRGFEGNVPLIQNINVFLIHEQIILAAISSILDVWS